MCMSMPICVCVSVCARVSVRMYECACVFFVESVHGLDECKCLCVHV